MELREGKETGWNYGRGEKLDEKQVFKKTEHSMCFSGMVALGKFLKMVWMFILWTKETQPFSSASSSASESPEKEKKNH